MRLHLARSGLCNEKNEEQPRLVRKEAILIYFIHFNSGPR